MNKTVKRIFRKFGYELSEHNAVPKGLGDDLFTSFFDKCKPHTMTTWERQYALYNSVQYIVHNRIPGDIVECGVWKGGSSMMAAYMLMHLKDTSRHLYLYDTYTGMAEPGEADSTYGSSAMNTWKKNQKGDINEWCYSPIEEVENNLKSTQYPADKLHFVKGKVEDSIPGTIPQAISILRLDTDWYSSTKHEMDHLYPLVPKGGVVIIDDYGYWEGSKKALIEYFAEHKLHPLIHRIDGSAIMFTKHT
jgi:O-methyltransferase